VDVRILAASNLDLESTVAAGAFRRDLYYHVNVVSLEMPAYSNAAKTFRCWLDTSPETTARGSHASWRGSPRKHRPVEAYDWPGNVWELEKAIKRALPAPTPSIPEDLAEALLGARGTAPRIHQE
jgi:DNA-binding NtrC family response regulator